MEILDGKTGAIGSDSHRHVVHATFVAALPSALKKTTGFSFSSSMTDAPRPS
jgi:hypothetical protein